MYTCDSIKLLSDLNRVTLDKAEQQKLVCFAVAAILGCSKSLPSSEVSDPYAYFLGTHKLSICQDISLLNEIFVFDSQRTSELVSSVWMSRYWAAYPKNYIGVLSFNDGRYICLDDQNWMNSDDHYEKVQSVISILVNCTGMGKEED